MLHRRLGFTLIELLCVIAIISMLTAIVLPVFGRVRAVARRTSCQSNLKQIGYAMQQYTSDFDGNTLPSWLSPTDLFSNIYGISWPLSLEPYVKNTQIFICPTAATKMNWEGDAPLHDSCWGSTNPGPNYVFNTVGGNTGNRVQGLPRVCYGVNAEIHKYNIGINESAITEPSLTFAVADSVWIDTTYAQRRRLARTWPRHLDGINALFQDGHVKWLGPDGLENLKFAP